MTIADIQDVGSILIVETHHLKTYSGRTFSVSVHNILRYTENTELHVRLMPKSSINYYSNITITFSKESVTATVP